MARKQRHTTIPEGIWRTFRDEGLTEAVDLNGKTEIERAYDLYKFGFSLTDAIDQVIQRRHKEEKA